MGPAARDVIVVANRQRLRIDLARVRRTVRTALRALGVWDHELSLTLVDDRTIRALNRWKFDLVSMDEVCRRAVTLAQPRRFACLTFDGGTKD